MVAAHARSAAAGTTQFPQFVLTAELGVVSGALHNFFSGSKPIAGIGPGITYSLFDAGRRSASADTEARRFDIAMLEYRKAAYVALSDVERALLGYQAATRAVQDASDASAAQTRAQDRTYAQFAAGRVSRLDLLNAQDKQLTLVAAESRAHRARLDSIVSLYLALGGGWVGASNTSPGAAAPAPH